MSDSLQPHGLYGPWNSPGQNTGVGKLFLSPGDLPNPGIKSGSPALQADSLPSEPPGKPRFALPAPTPGLDLLVAFDFLETFLVVSLERGMLLASSG